MRTTIRIDEHLLAEAKKYAAESGRTLTSVFADALREALSRRRVLSKQRRVRLRTVKGNGVQPGVNLDDTASLHELMES